jgi:LmbE family N-acetylglucosaminyl deacetylase
MNNMEYSPSKSVAVIVAHPDDETLWAGGTILSHPAWQWFIICLCRASDNDRSPKFFKVLKILNSGGIMGDLDDGPEQLPLDLIEVETTIMKLLPSNHFDLIITHNPNGEYTRHLRHEETGRTVIKLWKSKRITTSELWTFAYHDDNKKHLPVSIENANIYHVLSKQIWQKKYNIITETYGFGKNSFEAETTPKNESFWKFSDPSETDNLLNQIAIK